MNYNNETLEKGLLECSFIQDEYVSVENDCKTDQIRVLKLNKPIVDIMASLGLDLIFDIDDEFRMECQYESKLMRIYRKYFGLLNMSKEHFLMFIGERLFDPKTKTVTWTDIATHCLSVIIKQTYQEIQNMIKGMNELFTEEERKEIHPVEICKLLISRDRTIETLKDTVLEFYYDVKHKCADCSDDCGKFHFNHDMNENLLNKINNKSNAQSICFLETGQCHHEHENDSVTYIMNMLKYITDYFWNAQHFKNFIKDYLDYVNYCQNFEEDLNMRNRTERHINDNYNPSSDTTFILKRNMLHCLLIDEIEPEYYSCIDDFEKCRFYDSLPGELSEEDLPVEVYYYRTRGCCNRDWNETDALVVCDGKGFFEYCFRLLVSECFNNTDKLNIKLNENGLKMFYPQEYFKSQIDNEIISYTDYDKKLKEIATEHKTYCGFTHELSSIEGLSIEIIHGAFKGEYSISNDADDKFIEEANTEIANLKLKELSSIIRDSQNKLNVEPEDEDNYEYEFVEY